MDNTWLISHFVSRGLILKILQNAIDGHAGSTKVRKDKNSSGVERSTPQGGGDCRINP